MVLSSFRYMNTALYVLRDINVSLSVSYVMYLISRLFGHHQVCCSFCSFVIYDWVYVLYFGLIVFGLLG